MRNERLLVQYNILLLKTTVAARYARHCIRDERLLVEGSILLLKPTIVSR